MIFNPVALFDYNNVVKTSLRLSCSIFWHNLYQGPLVFFFLSLYSIFPPFSVFQEQLILTLKCTVRGNKLLTIKTFFSPFLLSLSPRFTRFQRYAMEHMMQDHLITGFASEKANPYRERTWSCEVLQKNNQHNLS